MNEIVLVVLIQVRLVSLCHYLCNIYQLSIAIWLDQWGQFQSTQDVVTEVACESYLQKYIEGK